MGGAGAGLRACDQSVNQVMATAAALIAAKKAKEKEAAMRAEQTEREQRRQLQQREMTPDNARIVEQKLLEFQKQQEVSHVSVRNGGSRNYLLTIFTNLSQRRPSSHLTKTRKSEQCCCMSECLDCGDCNTTLQPLMTQMLSGDCSRECQCPGDGHGVSTSETSGTDPLPTARGSISTATTH